MKEGDAQECTDPIVAILATMQCVGQANTTTCVSGGYDGTQFIKLHNDITTNAVINEGGSSWHDTLATSTLEIDINHQMNTEINQASIRFVKKVTTTDGSSLGLLP